LAGSDKEMRNGPIRIQRGVVVYALIFKILRGKVKRGKDPKIVRNTP